MPANPVAGSPVGRHDVRLPLLAGDAVVVAVQVAVVALGAVVDPVAALEVGDVATTVVRAAATDAVRVLPVEVRAVVVDAGVVRLGGQNNGGGAEHQASGGDARSEQARRLMMAGWERRARVLGAGLAATAAIATVLALTSQVWGGFGHRDRGGRWRNRHILLSLAHRSSGS